MKKLLAILAIVFVSTTQAFATCDQEPQEDVCVEESEQVAEECESCSN